MADNFMKDFLGFGIPDVYGNILKDPQKKALESQALKRGTTIGLLNFLTQPRNQNYGSVLPYLGQAVGSGLQTYQGGLDAGLATALKAKALETDDAPKFGTIDPSKYTPESVAKFEMTKKASDLRRITDPTTTKGLTDQELQGLITSIPGLGQDQVTQQLLKTDRTTGLKTLQNKYLGGEEGVKYTQDTDKIAKTFADRVNPDTGKTYKETYGNNITFDKLSTSDALAVLDEKQKRDIDLINAESKAKYDSPEGQWSRITTLNNKYEQALKSNQFDEMEKAFQQVQSASRQGTPIGDVATAIKIMKLLDPGSVVRESELGIALNQTSGLVDRWKTFVERKYTGEQLTETQRREFREIANDFYKIAQQSKNKLDARFINYAKGAGVDPSLVVGTPGGYLEYDEETGEFK